MSVDVVVLYCGCSCFLDCVRDRLFLAAENGRKSVSFGETIHVSGGLVYSLKQWCPVMRLSFYVSDNIEEIRLIFMLWFIMLSVSNLVHDMKIFNLFKKIYSFYSKSCHCLKRISKSFCVSESWSEKFSLMLEDSLSGAKDTRRRFPGKTSQKSQIQHKIIFNMKTGSDA